MKLATRLSPVPCSVYRQLQIGVENSSFRNAMGKSSALEALCDALYKSATTITTTILLLLLLWLWSNATAAFIGGSIPDVSTERLRRLERKRSFRRLRAGSAAGCVETNRFQIRNLAGARRQVRRWGVQRTMERNDRTADYQGSLWFHVVVLCRDRL